MDDSKDGFDPLLPSILFKCNKEKGDVMIFSPTLKQNIVDAWNNLPNSTSTCNHCAWIVTSCAGVAIQSEDGKVHPLMDIRRLDYDQIFANCDDSKTYIAFANVVASAHESKDWRVAKSEDLHSLPHEYPKSPKYNHFDCRGIVKDYDNMRQIVKDLYNMKFIQEQIKTLGDAIGNSDDSKFVCACIDELLKRGVPWTSKQIANLTGCHDFIMKAFNTSADAPDYDKNLNILMFQSFDVLKPCLETGSFGKNSILYDMVAFCQTILKDKSKLYKPQDVVKMFYGFLRKRMLVDGNAWACKGKAKELTYSGVGGVDSPPQKVADLPPDEQKNAICGYVCYDLDFLQCPVCHAVRHTGMKKWVCATCTFGNKLENALCEMCGIARPAN